MGTFADGRHSEAAIEEWVFAAWTDDGSAGIISGHRILGRTAWYWAALARAGSPLLHITDFEIQVRSNPFIVKGDALWAEHTCDAEMEQWSIGNETYALAIDDAEDALGTPYGHPIPVAFDLEWYATGGPSDYEHSAAQSDSSGYEQHGVVHGDIEILGEGRLQFTEIPANRWHRWSNSGGGQSVAALGPLTLPTVVAHTGVRAPFAFPDGSVSDLVLTTRGWAQRARPGRPAPVD